jgi:hypothetical protein
LNQIKTKVKSYRGIRDLKRAGEVIAYEDWQIEELRKCSEDPIYFIEKYVYVQSADGGEEQLLKLYPKQREYVLAIHENRNVLLLVGRQSGKTTVTMAYILWFSIFNENKQCAVLSNKAASARECLRRYQFSYIKLPKWLQQGVETWNKGDLLLENGSLVFTAATGPNSLTGRTTALCYIDEAAVVANNVAEDFFSSAWPTLSSGKTTKMIMTTTPRGYNHFYHRWKAAEEGRNSFIPIRMEWRDVPWRDEVWLEAQLKELGQLKFNQEVLCNFIGSSATLISGEAISKMVAEDPVYSKDGLDVYAAPEENHVYTVVCDVSRGLELDYSAFAVIDITAIPYRLVAKYRDNTISPMHYPDVISRVARTYNEAHVLIEIKEAGLEVANILHYELEYENILWVSTEAKRQQIVRGFGGNSQLGVMTSAAVKRLGCANFKTLVEEDKLLINDRETILEISTFMRVKNSYAADDGYNDDLVMCLVLFSWMTTCDYFNQLTHINTRKDIFGKKIKDLKDLAPFPAFSSAKDDIKGLFEDSVGNKMDLENMDEEQLAEMRWLIGDTSKLPKHFIMGAESS